MSWNKAVFHFVFLITFFSQVPTLAQSKRGITGVADTSYTLHGAYVNTVKLHPETKQVTLHSTRDVTIEKNVAYCQNGSRRLVSDIFYPASKTKSKRTALIIVHGGGWRSGNKSLHHPLAQQLAMLGYVCFTPEYRLSTEALFPAAVHDIKAAIRWVRSQASRYGIDADKIVVIGHSAGGQLAAFMGATNGKPDFEGNACHLSFSSKVNAVVDIDGILAFIHPESGEGDDSKRISAATNWFGYAKSENPELWKQGSPLTHIGPHVPPALFINSAVDRMHAGRDDFTILMDQFSIYNKVITFQGAPHSFPLFEPWFTPTVSAIDGFVRTVFSAESKKSNTVMIVAKDGSGHYTTVQDAFNAIPQNNTNPVTIYIRNGVYKEKLRLDSAKRFVTLLGEDKFNTILTYDDHTGKISPAGDTINTYTSHSFLQAADDFTARNITFQNNAGFSAGQAVAIQIRGDRVRFFNCRFLGNQDVLFPSRENTRQYFKNCYIEGTTDFIFGPSTAWFEACHIHSKKNSHVTAASTPGNVAYGYVFNDCVLTGDTTLRNVSLGRPWRPYASVTYLNCWIGNHILPEGWNNWRNADNERTARYAEYNSTGPGANPASRVKWARQLSANEAKAYTLRNILGTWDPEK